MPRRVRLRTAAARAISSLVAASASGASRDAVPRLVVVRRARSSARRRSRSAPRASGSRRRTPRRPSGCRISSKSKTRWRRRAQLAARAPGRPRTARRPSSARDTNRPAPGTRLEEAGQLRPVLVVQVDLAVVRAPAAAAGAGWSSSSASLKNALKTSSRNPSTPRSSQPRTIVEHGLRTAGLRQFTSGCSGRNVCK